MADLDHALSYSICHGGSRCQSFVRAKERRATAEDLRHVLRTAHAISEEDAQRAVSSNSEPPKACPQRGACPHIKAVLAAIEAPPPAPPQPSVQQFSDETIAEMLQQGLSIEEIAQFSQPVTRPSDALPRVADASLDHVLEFVHPVVDVVRDHGKVTTLTGHGTPVGEYVQQQLTSGPCNSGLGLAVNMARQAGSRGVVGVEFAARGTRTETTTSSTSVRVFGCRVGGGSSTHTTTVGAEGSAALAVGLQESRVAGVMELGAAEFAALDEEASQHVSRTVGKRV